MWLKPGNGIILHLAFSWLKPTAIVGSIMVEVKIYCSQLQLTDKSVANDESGALAPLILGMINLV